MFIVVSTIQYQNLLMQHKKYIYNSSSKQFEKQLSSQNNNLKISGEMEGSTQKCKIVLLGDQSVGKTSIINRFIFDNFTGNEQPTVGVDFVSKTVSVDNKNLRMQLWDTAGQQRFHSLIPSYIKDCNAAIIVFDLTSISSFNNLPKWIDNVRQVRGEQALIMVIGNKIDLEAEREVQRSMGEEKCKEIGCKYSQVSAKTGSNVKQFFKELAFTIAGGGQTKKSDGKSETTASAPKPAPTNNINLTTKNYSNEQGGKKKEKGGCC